MTSTWSRFNTCAFWQVVVGGSSGIGFSVCEEFLRAGAKVVSLSRSNTAAAGAQHVHCDLSSHESLVAAAAAVSALYGGVPTPVTLVLNAGHAKSDSARNVTQESLLYHLNVNVVSQVHTPARVQPLLFELSAAAACCCVLARAVTFAAQVIFTARLLPLLAPTSSIIWIGSTLSDRFVRCV